LLRSICAAVLAAGWVRALGFSLFDCLLSMLVVRWYSGLRSKVERHEIYLDELLLGNCRLRKTKLQTELTDRSTQNVRTNSFLAFEVELPQLFNMKFTYFGQSSRRCRVFLLVVGYWMFMSFSD
ncbi:hypothetical protein T11_12501, partial [Trichinella zimbabwensis]